ncbi:MAG TPA: metalloregulator ArsR/SmtB family transcription factor [Cellvibrionaceae bacterium]
MTPVELYKCLADDTRLRSLLLLHTLGELCVCDLVTALQLSQPKISRHLAQLRDCALVDSRKQGKWVYYRLHPALPHWVQGILHETASNNTDYLNQPLQRLRSGVGDCCT